MNQTYPPDWTYADFAAEFRAEFYSKNTNLSYRCYEQIVVV